jgi:hypothetical protein
MKTMEKRQLPRALPGEVPRGALTLLHGRERIIIERLRDISDSGISFSLAQAVGVSEKISIEYADPKVKLEVFGRVAWCSQAHRAQDAAPSGANYLLGVELLSPMMLYAVLPKAKAKPKA